MEIPTFKLKSGYDMPVIGLGTWQVKGNDVTDAVSYALEIGYKAIDTADVYGNHKEIGEAVKTSGIDRKELFITSKVWKDDLNKQDVLDACKRHLEELQMDYLDLYLIHWPNRSIPFADTFEALTRLKKEGLIRSIGVSNHTINHIEDILAIDAEVCVNQVEYHPSLNQEELRKYCLEKNIYLTAYSSLSGGHELEISAIQDIAAKHGVNVPQVIINWTVAKKMFAIPRSTKHEHIKSNLEALNFTLDADDMMILDDLNEPYRMVVPDHNEFDY